VTAESELAMYTASSYEASLADEWDRFIGTAGNGTFLHTRRYLAYHRDRFEDASLVVRTREGRLVAVLPAALSAAEPGREVVSHPGITFGGLVYGRGLYGDGLVAALSAVSTTLRSLGFDALHYRPVPPFARRDLGDEDVYAVCRLGGQRTDCQLSAVVDLARRPPADAKKRNVLRKAPRAGVTLHEGVEWLPDFWSLLTEQLAERHAATPVHSLTEMTELTQRFPDQIGLRVARADGGQLVAGALTYRYSSDTLHTQYLASNATGRKLAALDFLCESLIEQAARSELRFVSFGTSTSDDGAGLNDPLFRFKRSFGANGMCIETYRIPCSAS